MLLLEQPSSRLKQCETDRSVNRKNYQYAVIPAQAGILKLMLVATVLRLLRRLKKSPRNDDLL